MQSNGRESEQGDWLAFSVSILGTFMATLDSGIVNTALPTIGLGFNAGLPQMQWVVACYFLVISCLLLLFGRMGDMYGRKRMYTVGFVVFAFASALCGAAPNLGALIAARVGQGVGAAMLMANSPGIIMAAFPGAKRGRALGMVGLTVALGSLSGPGLGGLIIQGFGWRSVFFVNVPLALAGVIMARRFLPRQQRLRDETLDLAGAALFAIGMVGLLLAMTRGHEWGWLSTPVLGCLCLAGAAFVGFWLWERRCAYPMLDLSLFRIWPFSSGNIVAFMAFVSMFSGAILMPFYLHGQQGLEPYATGLALSTLPLAMAISAPLSGYLSERINFATLTSAGLGIMAVGLVLLASLESSSPLWRVYLGQMVLGIGVGAFMSPNNNSVLSSAPQDKVGLVGGVLALVRNVGMVTGIAVAITVFEGRQLQALSLGASQGEAFMAGFRTALGVGAFIALVAGGLSLYRRKLFTHPREKRHSIVHKDADQG